MPEISVAIPSHGGHERIVALLDSLSHQDCSSDEFSVLVIDNASPVPLVDVVRRYSSALDVRVIHEKNLGLAHARNRALNESSSDGIIFLDDDVLAAPELVEAYRVALRDPALKAGGGPIRPRLPGPQPVWFRWPVLSLFALQDLGSATSYGPRYPYGANFAVRRSAIRHPFDVRLGRKGRSLLSGEERRFFEQNAFEHIAHLPEASVEHVISEERLRLRWVARRALAQLQTRRALAAID